jgi:hypothetical protein
VAAWCAERKRLKLSEQVLLLIKSIKFFILSQRSICLYRRAMTCLFGLNMTNFPMKR